MHEEHKESVWEEIKEHIPFTGGASLIATVLVAIISLVYKQEFISISGGLFELLHPLHIIFSAFVTTAIYYKYKKQIIPAILIGVIGAIIIGSLSDIILPYLEANLLLLETQFHLPLIKEPIQIIGAALMGSILGLFMLKTKFPHFVHVFLSVFASLFYITAYSTNLTPLYLIAVFLIVFVAVIIPCCLSDIIFPLLFIKKKK